MINKQSLWFLTLFSLILVLSVYYVTMPNELLLTDNNNFIDDKSDNKESVTIKESDLLTHLRVDAEENRMSVVKDLELILTSIDVSCEEKNEAFDQIKRINKNRGLEEKLEKKIFEEFKLQSFVKINNDQINIVICEENHNYSLANNIMVSVQKEFETKKYVSIKFEN